MSLVRAAVRSKLAAALAGAGVMAVAGSIAWAAIPDTLGRIHVCYKADQSRRDGGSPLAIVDGARCGAGQTELTFNQVGRQGPRGPQGPAGPAGSGGSGGGLSGYETVFNGATCAAETSTSGGRTVALGKRCTVLATCPSGKRVLGGGYSIPLDTAYVDNLQTKVGPTVWALVSQPTNANGDLGAGPYVAWRVDVYNGSTANAVVAVQAACASA